MSGECIGCGAIVISDTHECPAVRYPPEDEPPADPEPIRPVPPPHNGAT